MASIYDPEITIDSVKRTSTPEEDKDNDGVPRYRVTAIVSFDLWGELESDVENHAKESLEHALS